MHLAGHYNRGCNRERIFANDGNNVFLLRRAKSFLADYPPERDRALPDAQLPTLPATPGGGRDALTVHPTPVQQPYPGVQQAAGLRTKA